MPKITLRVVPKPPEDSERTVYVSPDEGTVVMRSEHTGHDYVCGSCGATLVEGMLTDEVGDIIFRCNGCGAYNDTRRVDA